MKCGLLRKTATDDTSPMTERTKNTFSPKFCDITLIVRMQLKCIIVSLKNMQYAQLIVESDVQVSKSFPLWKLVLDKSFFCATIKSKDIMTIEFFSKQLKKRARIIVILYRKALRNSEGDCYEKIIRIITVLISALVLFSSCSSVYIDPEVTL